MPTLKDRLNRAFEQSRFGPEDNKSDFARCVGVSPQAVYQWFSGETKIGTANIFRAAECLGVDGQWLAHGKGSMRPDHRNVSNVDTDRKTPIISWIMAGDWQEAIDNHPPGTAEEWAPYIGGGDHVFALKVEGESMVGPELAFHPGEVIHVDPEQPTAPGDFVIARLEGSDQVTFKQLKEESGTPYLRPLNPHFPPIFGPFEIIGRVIGQTIRF